MVEKDVLLISRADEEKFLAVKEVVGHGVRFETKAKMIVIDHRSVSSKVGKIGILTAGTSNIQVAEEARTVAEVMGCDVMIAYDVGIAAFHRFLDPLVEMLDAGVDVIIVVAGMEGALASVVSSLRSFRS